MSYHLDQPIHVGECATCGTIQELEICHDCEHKAEKAKAPYLAFWAALAVDAELQRSFDYETQVFDSGHEVVYLPQLREYSIYDRAHKPRWLQEANGAWSFSVPLSEVVQWCIEHKEELI